MATSKIKVRALNKGQLDRDFVNVLIENRDKQFGFVISPKGTVDAAVLETEVDDKIKALVVAAIKAKVGVTIEQNPAYEDVKTDDGAAGDKKADDGINEGTRRNWVENGTLYEIV